MTNFNRIASKLDWKKLFAETKVVKPIYYTLSGSHLYGFNSPDSDIDIRGCHCEELYNVIGLHREIDVREKTIGEIDFVSFDLRKELSLVLANNSNVLEHLATEPVYRGKPYAELRSLAEKSLSKMVAKPYWGLAESNLHKYLRTYNESYREAPVKKYLYVIRSLMAGVAALERHRIEPNLRKLNKMRMFQISVVDELIELKTNGKEKMYVSGCKEADEAIVKLQKMFKESEESTTLPPTPNTFEAINKFLIDTRMR